MEGGGGEEEATALALRTEKRGDQARIIHMLLTSLGAPFVGHEHQGGGCTMIMG